MAQPTQSQYKLLVDTLAKLRKTIEKAQSDARMGTEVVRQLQNVDLDYEKQKLKWVSDELLSKSEKWIKDINDVQKWMRH
jgi:hypothetical protein